MPYWIQIWIVSLDTPASLESSSSVRIGAALSDFWLNWGLLPPVDVACFSFAFAWITLFIFKASSERWKERRFLRPNCSFIFPRSPPAPKASPAYNSPWKSIPHWHTLQSPQSRFHCQIRWLQGPPYKAFKLPRKTPVNIFRGDYRVRLLLPDFQCVLYFSPHWKCPYNTVWYNSRPLLPLDLSALYRPTPEWSGYLCQPSKISFPCTEQWPPPPWSKARKELRQN